MTGRSTLFTTTRFNKFLMENLTHHSTLSQTKTFTQYQDTKCVLLGPNSPICQEGRIDNVFLDHKVFF